MKRTSISMALILILLIPSLGLSQDKATKPAEDKSQTVTQTPPPQSLKAPLAFGLEDSTPIKLRLTRTLSSADAKTNDKIDFEVLEDVKVKDVVVIPRGGVAWGTVTDAMPKRRMGKAGKLDVNIDAVRLVTGEKAALRAVKEVVGGNHTGVMTGAIVATAIVFFPAAPFFLFMHGKDITIPQGTEITAYINGDTELDRNKIEAALQAVTAPAKPADSSAICIVMVKSIPDGGEITVDGKFVGNAPSTLRLTSGDHVISVTKTGFKTGEKTITLTAGGNITLEANLENN